MQTRVVLSDGIRPGGVQPAPASLFVVADLGHSFRALPLDEQRRMIEAALTEALGLAIEKIEDAHTDAARLGAVA